MARDPQGGAGVIAQNFEYSTPATLAEALAAIGGGAKALAGGMSLIPAMKLRLSAPDQVVDLARIPGLSGICEDGGALQIGAMTTHYAVESSKLVRTKCPLLAATAAEIGDVQVRNVGTIGGSAAHADPAADYPAALVALDAEFHIASPGGTRTVTGEDFFIDLFTTALEPGELITAVKVPVEEAGTGTSYQKMVHPASGYAIVGIAARIRRSGGKVTFARIGVTGLGPKAYRAKNAEQALLNGADAATAAALVAEGVDANTDIHASAEYRSHMAAVYAARAIRAALA